MAIKVESGFSVAELLVATVMVFVLIGVIYNTFRVQILTTKSQESRVVAQEYSRTALDIMVREIRNLGYFPTGVACATIPANTNGIITANAQSIRYVYDVNSDNDCADLDEDVTYQYQAPGPQNCPAGFGDITRTANGNTQALTNCNVPNTAGSFSFTYFPQDCNNSFTTPVGGGAPICPTGANAGTLAAIQRILISLTVQSMGPDREFGGGRLDAIMTSSVNLRNRGL